MQESVSGLWLPLGSPNVRHQRLFFRWWLQYTTEESGLAQTSPVGPAPTQSNGTEHRFGFRGLYTVSLWNRRAVLLRADTYWSVGANLHIYLKICKYRYITACKIGPMCWPTSYSIAIILQLVVSVRYKAPSVLYIRFFGDFSDSLCRNF